MYEENSIRTVIIFFTSTSWTIRLVSLAVQYHGNEIFACFGRSFRRNIRRFGLWRLMDLARRTQILKLIRLTQTKTVIYGRRREEEEEEEDEEEQEEEQEEADDSNTESDSSAKSCSDYEDV
ncbi:unnamed protein product [Trichogramma brassicae]|uniref:Uncharacterized protein n=1 Tax=Trichogramma brassicae TaxID=86971 RepID=A0A6H5HZ04_9HYME|nr:unnamed protein product [Trichogramma brassicae]